MPLNPVALAADIKALLVTIPMGTGVVSASVAGTPGPDGTMNTSCSAVPGPILMDPGLANTIAQAVATAVVKHLTTMAVVNPTTGAIA
jgi:hypothetical protein